MSEGHRQENFLFNVHMVTCFEKTHALKCCTIDRIGIKVYIAIYHV